MQNSTNEEYFFQKQYIHTLHITYIYAYNNTYIHTYITYVLNVHIHTNTYIHYIIHTCIHIFIHSCKHTYIHSFIHTYITFMLFNLEFAASFCRRMLPPLLSCFCRLCSPLCCCLYSPHFGCLWSPHNCLCSSCIVIAASARLVLPPTLTSLCRLRSSLSSVTAATTTLDKTFTGVHKKYKHIYNIYMHTHMQ